MFRTGDYGRIVGGQLVYEGRSDSQVKVRGHRVDLSEVYNNISQLPEVSVCVVLCYKPGEPEQVNHFIFNLNQNHETDQYIKMGWMAYNDQRLQINDRCF